MNREQKEATMAEFFQALDHCMSGKGMLIPNLYSVDEAVDFVGRVQEAFELAGGSKELLIGALIVSAPFLAEGELVVLETMAQVAVCAYIFAIAYCICSAGGEALLSKIEAGEVPQGFLAALDEHGIDPATAVA
jgi:hypothetical protein